jgi:hypothetical protein
MYFKKNDCVDYRFEPGRLPALSVRFQRCGFDPKNTGYAVFISHFWPDIFN